MQNVIAPEAKHRAEEGALSTMEIIARAPELVVYTPPLWSLPSGRDWLAQLFVSAVAGGGVTVLVMGALIAGMNWALGL